MEKVEAAIKNVPDEIVTLLNAPRNGTVTFQQLQDAAKHLEQRTWQKVQIITREDFEKLPSVGVSGRLPTFEGIPHEIVAWNEAVDEKNRQRKLRKLIRKRIVDVDGVPIVKETK